MKKLLCFVVAATITLAGCAKPPSKIAPAVVSSSEYSSLSCSKLVNMLSAASTKLEQAEDKIQQRLTTAETALHDVQRQLNSVAATPPNNHTIR